MLVIFFGVSVFLVSSAFITPIFASGNTNFSVKQYDIVKEKAQPNASDVLELKNLQFKAEEDGLVYFKINFGSSNQYEFSSKVFLSSLDYDGLLWFDVDNYTKDYQILTLDIMPYANMVYLSENDFSLLDKTVIRIVIQDNIENKIYAIFNEFAFSEYEYLKTLSDSIYCQSEVYNEYQTSVNLIFSVINYEGDYIEENIIAPDHPIVSSRSSLKRCAFLLTYSDDFYYGGTSDDLDITSLGITISTNGLGYLLETVFPEEVQLAKLINTSSYGTTIIYSNGYKDYIFVKSWVSTLYPGQIHSSYMQMQSIADILGLELTLQFSEFYKFIPAWGDVLLYGGQYSNNLLEEFSFVAKSKDEDITYIKLSNIGLYELPTYTGFDLNRALMDIAIFTADYLAPWQIEVGAALIETAFDSCFDSGGFVNTNEEYNYDNQSVSFNQYISLSDTHNINIVLDPKWIMISPYPNSSYSSTYARYKTVSLDIRYGENPYDSSVQPTEYYYRINFKKYQFYLTNDSYNNPAATLMQLGHTVYYIIPSGC